MGYQPGRHAWLKLRTRASAEAVVGAITGTLGHPDSLILGLPAADGSLVIAGSTVTLKPGQQKDVASHLAALAGTIHGRLTCRPGGPASGPESGACR